MKETKLRYGQKGAVLVIVATMSLLVLMGVSALAIDLSKAEKIKTQVQNLADAMAESAAVSINKQEKSVAFPKVEAYAENYAKTSTFALFNKTGTGVTAVARSENQELANVLNTADIIFRFAETLSTTATDWKPASDTYWNTHSSKFVRVVINTMNTKTWFGRIWGLANIKIGNTAVAGTEPTKPCDLIPLVMCSENPSAPDTNCKDDTNSNGTNDCYGYEIENLYCMASDLSQADNSVPNSPLNCAISSSTGTYPYGAGNIGLLDFSAMFPDLVLSEGTEPTNGNAQNTKLNPGAKTVETCLAGEPACQDICDAPDPENADVNTGAKWSAVRDGIGSYFNQQKGQSGYPSDIITGYKNKTQLNITAGTGTGLTIVGPDRITAAGYATVPVGGIPLNTFSSPNPYQQYKTYTNAGTPDGNATANAKAEKRVIGVPFVDCSTWPAGTKAKLPIKGYGCFWLAAPPEKGASQVYILGSFVGDEACNATGTPTSVVDYGYDRVVLYKDPFGEPS